VIQRPEWVSVAAGEVLDRLHEASELAGLAGQPVCFEARQFLETRLFALLWRDVIAATIDNDTATATTGVHTNGEG